MNGQYFLNDWSVMTKPLLRATDQTMVNTLFNKWVGNEQTEHLILYFQHTHCSDLKKLFMCYTYQQTQMPHEFNVTSKRFNKLYQIQHRHIPSMSSSITTK